MSREVGPFLGSSHHTISKRLAGSQFGKVRTCGLHYFGRVPVVGRCRPLSLISRSLCQRRPQDHREWMRSFLLSSLFSTLAVLLPHLLHFHLLFTLQRPPPSRFDIQQAHRLRWQSLRQSFYDIGLQAALVFSFHIDILSRPWSI